jgi:organic radical activating enzyme
MADAYLSEIFSSIQGEGPHVGRRALFIRFGGCNLSCGYCDTGYARERAPSFKIFSDSKTSGEREVSNPVACREVPRMISDGLDLPDIVVMTGGEPLLQADALGEIAGELRMRGCSVHLETNGTLSESLASVRPAVDFVSVDIKLPSMLGGIDLNDRHAEFLKAMENLSATRSWTRLPGSSRVSIPVFRSTSSRCSWDLGRTSAPGSSAAFRHGSPGSFTMSGSRFRYTRYWE